MGKTFRFITLERFPMRRYVMTAKWLVAATILTQCANSAPSTEFAPLVRLSRKTPRLNVSSQLLILPKRSDPTGNLEPANQRREGSHTRQKERDRRKRKNKVIK